MNNTHAISSLDRFKTFQFLYLSPSKDKNYKDNSNAHPLQPLSHWFLYNQYKNIRKRISMVLWNFATLENLPDTLVGLGKAKLTF